MRPQKDGALKYQDEQKEEWCKGMPIGSSRTRLVEKPHGMDQNRSVGMRLMSQHGTE